MIEKLLLTTSVFFMGGSRGFTTVDQDGLDILPKEDDLSFHADIIQNTKYR